MKQEFMDLKIAEFSRRYPHKIAIKTDDQAISYLELEEKSNQIANFMNDKIEKTPHVITILDRSPELIESIIGLLKCGLVFVPLNPLFPGKMIKKMIEEIRAEWVITSLKYYKKFGEIIKGSGTNGTHLKTLLCDGEDDGSDSHDNIFYLDSKIERDGYAFERVYNKDCYIYFTSGSTGIPKGVLGRHTSLAHFIQWEMKEFGVNEDFHISQFTSPSFDPFLRDIFLPLMAGATSHIPSHDTLMNMRKLIRWIDEHKINLIHTVPSLFKNLVFEINDSNCFHNLRYILLAGELLRGRDIYKFIETFNDRIQLVNVYGPTETTLAKLFYPIKPGDVKRTIIPVGKPIDDAQVLILDSKRQKCRQGRKGEIYIRTPFISSGYYNDPLLTKKLFIKNPYGKHDNDIIYKTGDQGRLLRDGNIELTGRTDFQVKIRGARVELGEIENQLLTYDGVQEAVVTVKEDNNGEKYLCAYVALVSGIELDIPSLREYLSRELPNYMIPSYFVTLDKIPLTPNGKIDRTMLPEPKKNDINLGIDYLAPENSIEKRIADIWKEILQLDKVGVNYNFFDIGGDSLKIIAMSRKLNEEFNKDIPIPKIFANPTISFLAKYLKDMETGKTDLDETFEKPEKEVKNENKFQQEIKKDANKTGKEIAVIGMSCRFPGARNFEEFWKNLKEGKEAITFLSYEELLNAGVSRDLFSNPNYVRAVNQITDKEYFDARFFGYTPREAELLDPQIRLFHECSWEAIEDSGITPDFYSGAIGVYAGAMQNLEWEMRAALSGKSRAFGLFAASKLTGIRYLCTRLSYNLNLKGPSVTMQTACSTSLVAIHMACRALLDGECDVAIAGGVTVSPEEKYGYLYEEDMIYSQDGHCRSFDAKGNGTLFGEGVGAVVLKPLEDAITENHHIYAVIKGSAINNDGNRKVGFTAPSVSGQVEVIRAALQIADVEPGSISYIEAHGTATTLGDPIEIEALKQAFNTDKKKYCKIGSVKSNLGHLDTAAGVAGFIKAVLSLKNRMIPPSLYFETPNPAIDFDNSPFQVNTRLIEWKRGRYPLRAGINSLGMGGTNAHLVLEEAPQREESSESKNHHILLLSAKSENSLNMASKNLADFLRKNDHIKLADVAYTLQTGRKRFNHRRMFTCSSIDEAVENLSASAQDDPLSDIVSTDDNPAIVFMFPGQGSQYVNMGLELYGSEPVFREEMDRCFAILNPLIGCDLKKILYPGLNTPESEKIPGEMKDINRTEITQPVIFALEYSLARLLINWGVKPNSMIGHSIGEYTAACLSGVYSLEDTLTLVALRGKLMQKMPTGSMLSVQLSEDELKPLLGEELEIAAVNSSTLCVVSGTDKAIEKFAEKLKKDRYECRKLVTSSAFHSRMMDPMLPEFEAKVKQFHLKKPGIPYISNLNGDWILDEDVTNSNYWARHLRETVRFSEGLAKLLCLEKTIFIEVGPGNALSKFVNLHSKKTNNHIIMNIVRHPRENVSDVYYLLNKIGRLWIYGQQINRNSFYPNEKRHLISLPPYPFDRQYYWIEKFDYSNFNNNTNVEKKKEITDWFYIPSWKRSVSLPENKIEYGDSWNMIFMDDCGLSSGLLNKFEQDLEKSIRVNIGTGYNEVSSVSFTINPASDDDYEKLFRRLSDIGQIPDRIIHLWNVTGCVSEPLSIEATHRAQDIGFYSLINIAKATGNIFPDKKVDIIVITDNMQDVNGTESITPEKSTILGPIQVIPQEYSNISCRSIDIELPGNNEKAADILIRSLYDEFNQRTCDRIIAYRGGQRWTHILEPVKLSRLHEVTMCLKPGSVYLITGGLGGIGLVLAEYLSKTVKPKLVITGRSDFPGKEEWNNWQNQYGPEDKISKKIEILESIEKNGSEISYLKVDVSKLEEMEEKLKEVERDFGKINGIIHTAGLVDFAGIILRRSREENEIIFAAKLYGTLVLNNIFRDRNLDFFVLCSSMSSLCAHFGQVGYSSANAFLDAYAKYETKNEKTFTISVNWDSWSEVGMAAEQLRQIKEGQKAPETGISPSEGVEVFTRAIDHRFSNLAVSTIDFEARMETHQINDKIVEYNGYEKESSVSNSLPGKSNLLFESVSMAEENMIEIWRGLLGHEKIETGDNFFELGGDSLTAVEMRKRIREDFNLDIPLVKIYHFPTIRTFVSNLLIEENESNISISQQENTGEFQENLNDMLNKFEEI